MRVLDSIIVLTCLAGCASPHAEVQTSSATQFSAVGIVDLRTYVPDIALDIRYAGSNNFVGTPIDGYAAPKCFVLEPVARALQRIEHDLRKRDHRLKIFDCYRPIRAVKHFVRWADDARAQQMKSQFYPDLDKSNLLGEYIAPVSGHSRAATLDLTLVSCDVSGAKCAELDMGTPFDLFDPRAHTDYAGLTPEQRQHRNQLREAMRREGFENYPSEWWHYTLKPERLPLTAYDIPIE